MEIDFAATSVGRGEGALPDGECRCGPASGAGGSEAEAEAEVPETALV